MRDNLRNYCISLYLKMEKRPAPVIADFARHILDIPADRDISFEEIDRFHAQMAKQKNAPEANLASTKEFPEGYRLFKGERKAGELILLYGPAELRRLGNQEYYVLKKEEARSPAAILSILAVTSANGEIVVRQEAIERQVKIKGWGSAKELIQLVASHEISHRVFNQKHADPDKLALSALLRAQFPGSCLEIYNEMLAEWMPEEFGGCGGLIYLAKLARIDHEKATKMFFCYLSDYGFSSGELREMGREFYASVLPYINGCQVDFERLLRDAPKVFAYYLNCFEERTANIQELFNRTKFSFNRQTVSFPTLAKKQIEMLLASRPDADQTAPYFCKRFWENMLIYSKNCAENSYSELKILLSAAK